MTLFKVTEYLHCINLDVGWVRTTISAKITAIGHGGHGGGLSLKSFDGDNRKHFG